jgi:hypothetical protein
VVMGSLRHVAGSRPRGTVGKAPTDMDRSVPHPVSDRYTSVIWLRRTLDRITQDWFRVRICSSVTTSHSRPVAVLLRPAQTTSSLGAKIHAKAWISLGRALIGTPALSAFDAMMRSRVVGSHQSS